MNLSPGFLLQVNETTLGQPRLQVANSLSSVTHPLASWMDIFRLRRERGQLSHTTSKPGERGVLPHPREGGALPSEGGRCLPRTAEPGVHRGCRPNEERQEQLDLVGWEGGRKEMGWGWPHSTNAWWRLQDSPWQFPDLDARDLAASQKSCITGSCTSARI